MQNAQKLFGKKFKFVHTYFEGHAIIILVKPPNTLYFLLYPIVKIPSPKKAAIVAVFFLSFLLIQVYIRIEAVPKIYFFGGTHVSEF